MEFFTDPDRLAKNAGQELVDVEKVKKLGESALKDPELTLENAQIRTWGWGDEE